jgi:hypothetical protein
MLKWWQQDGSPLLIQASQRIGSDRKWDAEGGSGRTVVRVYRSVTGA